MSQHTHKLFINYLNEIKKLKDKLTYSLKFVVNIKEKTLSVYLGNKKSTMYTVNRHYKMKDHYYIFPELVTVDSLYYYEFLDTIKTKKGSHKIRYIEEIRTKKTPKDLGLWLLTYKEFYELVKDNLYMSYLTGASKFTKVTSQETLEDLLNFKLNHQTVNIDGKLKGLILILDKEEDKSEEISSSLKIHSTMVKHAYTDYNSTLISSTIPEIKIALENYDKLINPDVENASKLLSFFKLPQGDDKYRLKNNPEEISFDNLQKLYEHCKAKDISIIIYDTNMKGIFFIDINELISYPNHEGTLEKILDAVKNNKNYIIKNGDTGYFDINEVNRLKEKIFNYLIKKDAKDFLALMKKAKEVSKTNNDTKVVDLIKSNGFTGEPRDHQIQGINWLKGLYDKEIPGCILADEQGLGKTIQTIGFLSTIPQKDIKKQKIIIVAPASVVGVWENEIKTFNPFLESLINKNIFIMSFDRAIREKISGDIVIVDEAQYIKNNKTQRFQKLKEINSRFNILLSGTPIENSVTDIYSLIELIDDKSHELTRLVDRFAKVQAATKMQKNSSDLNGTKNIAVDLNAARELVAAEKIRELIDPIMLQRKKSAEHLSAKLNINEEEIKPNPVEILLTKEIGNFFKNEILKSQANNNHDFYSINQMLIGLMRLRQAVSYPNQLPPELVTHFSKKLQTGLKTLTPSKAVRTLEIYKEIKKKDKNGKLVVFTTFTETRLFLKDYLSKNGAKVLTFGGSDSTSKRKELINEFQEQNTFDVFVIALKSAATGITLHRANNIIIYDLYWNPQVIAQAVARVHRIGQDTDVNAYLLQLSGSVDDNIKRIIDKKKMLANVFDKKESSGTQQQNTSKNNGLEVAEDFFGIKAVHKKIPKSLEKEINKIEEGTEEISTNSLHLKQIKLNDNFELTGDVEFH